MENDDYSIINCVAIINIEVIENPIFNRNKRYCNTKESSLTLSISRKPRPSLGRLGPGPEQNPAPAPTHERSISECIYSVSVVPVVTTYSKYPINSRDHSRRILDLLSVSRDLINRNLLSTSCIKP